MGVKSDKIEMDNDNDSEQKDDDNDNEQQNEVMSVLKRDDLRKCVFGTIDGSIGVLISIPHSRYNVLQKLEKSLRKFVHGLGGLDHCEWRKFKNQTESKISVGFLDGDLIETFLNLTSEQQQKVADDTKIGTA